MATSPENKPEEEAKPSDEKVASSAENNPKEGAKPSDEKVPERKSSERSPGRKSREEVAEWEPSGGRKPRLERKSIQPELPERQPGERPHFRVCYLCKREFGSQSYPIHIPQCQKKWLLEEAKKPMNERRRLPPPPYDEESIKVGGPPQEDDFGGEAKSAFEASLAKCPHCQRQFVPKALQHHSIACTEARPFFKAAGTGLNSMALTNRLVPGKIAGSQHGRASAQPKLSKEIGLFTDWKTLSERRAAREDLGQSSKSKPDDPCACCGTRDRLDSKYCSSCGKKRPVDPSSPTSSTSSKEEHQDVVFAWLGKSPSASPKESREPPAAAGGRETPIAVKDQDKLIVQSGDSTVEIVIQMRSFPPGTRPKSA